MPSPQDPERDKVCPHTPSVRVSPALLPTSHQTLLNCPSQSSPPLCPVPQIALESSCPLCQARLSAQNLSPPFRLGPELSPRSGIGPCLPPSAHPSSIKASNSGILQASWPPRL